MHHERSERHVRADRAYPLDDHWERRGRVLLLGKGAVLTQRVAGPLAAELDEKQQHESSSEPPRHECCIEAEAELIYSRPCSDRGEKPLTAQSSAGVV